MVTQRIKAVRNKGKIIKVGTGSAVFVQMLSCKKENLDAQTQSSSYFSLKKNQGFSGQENCLKNKVTGCSSKKQASVCEAVAITNEKVQVEKKNFKTDSYKQSINQLRGLSK